MRSFWLAHSKPNFFTLKPARISGKPSLHRFYTGESPRSIPQQWEVYGEPNLPLVARILSTPSNLSNTPLKPYPQSRVRTFHLARRWHTRSTTVFPLRYWIG